MDLPERAGTTGGHGAGRAVVGAPATTTWEELEALVAEHRLTPVLGSGLPDSILGAVPYIVRRWVQRWQLPIAPRDQGNLAKVAQYLVRNASRGSMLSQFQEHLAQEISDRRNQATPADLVWDLPDDLLTPDNLELAIREVGRNLRMMDMMDPHRIMAALPLPVYVTAEWTYLLEDALFELGKEPMVRRFDWTDKADWDDDLKDFKPTVQHPLVYHLFGHLDNPDSLVLTEDDHFEWLKAWLTRRSSIPRAVVQALTAQSLLFLDCRLDDWHLRFVLLGIKSFPASNHVLDRNLHVAVLRDLENQAIESEAVREFGLANISIYWGETREFLNEMQERMRIAF